MRSVIPLLLIVCVLCSSIFQVEAFFGFGKKNRKESSKALRGGGESNEVTISNEKTSDATSPLEVEKLHPRKMRNSIRDVLTDEKETESSLDSETFSLSDEAKRKKRDGRKMKMLKKVKKDGNGHGEEDFDFIEADEETKDSQDDVLDKIASKDNLPKTSEVQTTEQQQKEIKPVTPKEKSEKSTEIQSKETSQQPVTDTTKSALPTAQQETRPERQEKSVEKASENKKSSDKVEFMDISSTPVKKQEVKEEKAETTKPFVTNTSVEKGEA